MQITRKLRLFLFPIAFVLVFIMAGYCTFPKDVLKEMAESSLTGIALKFGPRNRGLPEVSIKNVSLWRLSGVTLKNVNISWPERKNESPLVINLDAIKGRVGIFSLLTGSRSYSGGLRFYGGELGVSASLKNRTSLNYLKLDGTKIDFAKMGFIEQTLGAPLQGMLQILLALRANSEMSKDGTGSIKLSVDNMAYGPGAIKLPAAGMMQQLTVPKINLGKLTAEFSIDKGQLETKAFTLSGGDVEADIKLSVTIGKKTTSSRLAGNGWFSIKRELVNTNETLKMLYDLMPVLRAAHQGDGKVGILLRGNLARPDISIERYAQQK